MLNIYGKQWHDLTSQDIEGFLQTQEIEETFFFEFKDDRLTSAGFAKEVSALANTYGGYIFIGVSDDKAIEGCSQWDEQRIHVTIHDSITPTPSFDVKRFVVDGKTIYVVRVDEGSEPPYITNKGSIFERLSSGSFAIKDSAKLMHLYNKNEQNQKRIIEKITIEPITETVNNVYGYIDIGFSLTVTDRQLPIDAFKAKSIKETMAELKPNRLSLEDNLVKLGNSYFYTHGGLKSNYNKMPAHLNNFIEIMCDGSARMRVVLFSRDPDKTTVFMGLPFSMVSTFQMLYKSIMGSLFPNNFIYAKKYESLTVLKQFQPAFMLDPELTESNPELEEKNKARATAIRENRTILGKDTVVTSNRIPKTGLFTVDRQTMQLNGCKEYTAESIIDFLFSSQFTCMGYQSQLK